MDKKLTKWSYLEPFLFTRESLHLLDISRKLGENHTTVRKYLNQFTKEGFLKISQKGRLTLYELNLDFSLVVDYLSMAEKEFLLSKCFQNKMLKELISDVHKIASGPVILFGSSVNNFSKAGDVDIICSENLNFDKLEEKYDREFHVVRMDKIDQIKDALKLEVLKKHLSINCTEEIVKWLI
jgi:hypothetical protein